MMRILIYFVVACVSVSAESPREKQLAIDKDRLAADVARARLAVDKLTEEVNSSREQSTRTQILEDQLRHTQAEILRLQLEIKSRPTTVILPESAQTQLKTAREDIRQNNEVSGDNQRMLYGITAAIGKGFSDNIRLQLTCALALALMLGVANWILWRRDRKRAKIENEERYIRLVDDLKKAQAGQEVVTKVLSSVVDVVQAKQASQGS